MDDDSSTFYTDSLVLDHCVAPVDPYSRHRGDIFSNRGHHSRSAGSRVSHPVCAGSAHLWLVRPLSHTGSDASSAGSLANRNPVGLALCSGVGHRTAGRQCDESGMGTLVSRAVLWLSLHRLPGTRTGQLPSGSALQTSSVRSSSRSAHWNDGRISDFSDFLSVLCSAFTDWPVRSPDAPRVCTQWPARSKDL